MRNLRIIATQSACLFVLLAVVSMNDAAAETPCPPTISIDGESGGTPNSACPGQAQTQPLSVSGEYGPSQIVGGQCPRIPGSFQSTYTVSSESEFTDAYSRVQPGEAIVIQDGSYAWKSDFVLDKNGTSQNPIYIVYESLQGAVFSNSTTEFRVSGSWHVIAGMRFNSHGDEVFYLTGNDNRIACHYFQASGGNGYVYISGGGADRNEVDNNVFDDHNSIALNLTRCDPQLASCLSNATGTHIHHNTWKNRSSDGNGSEAIKLGSGYKEPDGATIFNADGNNLDAIVENNLFDNWNGEAELISIKGDRNIIRNNCIKNSTISNIVVRTGDNNLITGNWSDSVKEGIRISGRGNYYVFNYRRAYNGGQMFRLHPGQLHADGARYAYIDGSNNVLRYNVSSNMTRLVETEPRLTGSYVFRSSPVGNVISDNVLYSDSLDGSNGSGSYMNKDSNWVESEFRANNTWGANSMVNRDLPASECGNSTLFDGPGGPGASVPGSSSLLGAPSSIDAPDWW